MTARVLLKKANEMRVQEHRLKPRFRLQTIKEVHEFIHDRELVSFLGGNELPGFISAVLGRSWRPSKKGFAGWMDWWSVRISGQPIAQVAREIEGREDILATRLFRQTKTFVSSKLWPTLDPIIKHQGDLARKGEIFSDLERKVFRTIEEEASIRTDQLRKALKLEAKQNNSNFHRALSNLENYSLIVGVEDPHPEKHLHANIWRTWASRTGETVSDNGLSYERAIASLLERTIHACVLARVDQVEKWFPWGKDMKGAETELIDQTRIIKAGSYLVSPLVNPQ